MTERVRELLQMAEKEVDKNKALDLLEQARELHLDGRKRPLKLVRLVVIIVHYTDGTEQTLYIPKKMLGFNPDIPQSQIPRRIVNGIRRGTRPFRRNINHRRYRVIFEGTYHVVDIHREEQSGLSLPP